ncbi:MAG: phosphoribosylformylglycinamidine cyclo-ligase [Planctomycetes bacterium]|nr:phosphoribosylformylglycinamidine cyclo-ligase [Planctomycetota bacterium]
MAKVSYKDAGVDLDIYEQSMARLPRLMHRTFCPRVLKLDGGFAGLFQLDFPSSIFSRKYDDPVLVSCTDGVGTKLKIAQRTGFHGTIGIDLVAMCVNDALCCGAEPLFFLDYVAMSRDDPGLLESIVTGISDGCIQADCALLGGETAIMPDLYAPGDYDLAGFCVGVVERKRLITGSAIARGDVVLGLASTGVHSNGYSLVRKLVFEIGRFDVNDMIPSLGATVGEVLLAPTRIYAPTVRRILRNYRVKQVVHGIAHITGGGLGENIARIVPRRCDVVLQRGSWPVPPVFDWLRRLGDVDTEEMDRVFNMGIGMALVVSPHFVDSIVRACEQSGEAVFPIGTVVAGQGDVRFAA